MTDRADESGADRAARLAALQQRRQETAPAAATGSRGRRHAAAGGRVLAAGLSVSASLVLTTVMAGARPTASSATPTPSLPGSPQVVIVRRSPPSTTPTTMAATPASPAPANNVNLTPVTTTGAS